MEHEVNALMGAADEEFWEKAGLFSSMDELCESKHSKCQPNVSFNTPPATTTEFPIPHNSCTKLNHQFSRGSRVFQRSGNVVGKSACGQVDRPLELDLNPRQKNA
jgi:hypothetical protein